MKLRKQLQSKVRNNNSSDCLKADVKIIVFVANFIMRISNFSILLVMRISFCHVSKFSFIC